MSPVEASELYRFGAIGIFGGNNTASARLRQVRKDWRVANVDRSADVPANFQFVVLAEFEPETTIQQIASAEAALRNALLGTFHPYRNNGAVCRFRGRGNQFLANPGDAICAIHRADVERVAREALAEAAAELGI